ncbi:hypothetical protein, partial [Mesorhizobium sp.]|uniref:hypothetical protein n=1 Tax=Mesorhizobium sp. TaxID=1871066 RepID=UPI0025C48A16
MKDNQPPLQGPKQKARVQTALSHEALEKKPSGQFIVGMTNSAPSLMPAACPQPQRGEDARPKTVRSVHRRDDELGAVLD